MAWLAGLLAMPLLLGFSACGRPSEKTNVLLVTIDTLRADRLGSYGYAAARTPQLDRVAREGVRCSDAISAAPITAPSHSSILTGLLPPAHGVRDNGTYALPPEVKTLAERLAESGFATHAIVSAIVLARRYGLDQGFESYDDDLWSEDEPKLFMIRDRPARRTADRFLDWLTEHDRKEPARPFFAWVHFFDPHQPYQPEAIDRALTATPYDAEIAGVDRALGRILDRLRESGELDRTLLVITADHGESLGEHGEKTHAIFVYDATVKVPLLLRLPRLLPAGRVYEGPLRSIDLVPTVLAALGLPGGEETQGRNLLPALRGDEAAPRLPQYSESLVSELGFGMAPLYALRADGYKWIRAPRPELYRLDADPGETASLAETERRVGARLDGELGRLLEESRARAVSSAANPMDQETREALVSLGYLARPDERERMSGIDPKDGLPLYNKLEDARHLSQEERWAESEELLREILSEIPGHVSARNVLALAMVRQGRWDDAVAEYRRSLASDPNQARVLAMLGAIELTRDRLDEAEKLYRAALAITPGFVEAVANLGFIADLRGDSAAARRLYDQALAADPRFPRARRLAADWYYERGEWAPALAAYEQVLAGLPEDFEATLQAGNCLRRLGRSDAAEKRFLAAAKLRPDSWMPLYNRACLAAVGGRPEDALGLLGELAGRGFPPARLELLDADPDLAAVRRLPGFPPLRRRLAAPAP